MSGASPSLQPPRAAKRNPPTLHSPLSGSVSLFFPYPGLSQGPCTRSIGHRYPIYQHLPNAAIRKSLFQTLPISGECFFILPLPRAFSGPLSPNSPWDLIQVPHLSQGRCPRTPGREMISLHPQRWSQAPHLPTTSQCCNTQITFPNTLHFRGVFLYARSPSQGLRPRTPGREMISLHPQRWSQAPHLPTTSQC